MTKLFRVLCLCGIQRTLESVNELAAKLRFIALGWKLVNQGWSNERWQCAACVAKDEINGRLREQIREPR